MLSFAETAAECVNESKEIKLKNDKISLLKEKLSNVQQTTNAQQRKSEQSMLMLKKEIEQLQQVVLAAVCWLLCGVWCVCCGGGVVVCCVLCVLGVLVVGCWDVLVWSCGVV